MCHHVFHPKKTKLKQDPELLAMSLARPLYLLLAKGSIGQQWRAAGWQLQRALGWSGLGLRCCCEAGRQYPTKAAAG
jgi:hypothetical protein